MGNINTGSFSKALDPFVQSWYGLAYKQHDPQYSKVFETRKSRKAFEEIVGATGLGLAAVKPEGQPVQYDTARQGATTRFTHVEYALGTIITRNMVDDDQHDVIGKMRVQELAKSMRATKEVVAWNVLNRADTSGYTGGDGVVLLSASHPYFGSAGGTWSNQLTTAADLSEAALEQAHIDIGKWENDRGIKIAVKPMKLIIPVDLQFEAERILESEKRSGTADNDKNVMMGRLPGGVVVSNYLTDANMWFIQTDTANGLIHFERRPDEFKNDSDFDTDNAKYKASGRYSFGWADPRCIFGSNPA